MGIHTPFPIDGTVYDIDGATLVNSAKVIVLNTTTQEKVSETTNSLGQFIVDIGNLTSGYSNGDRLQITTFYGTGSGERSLSRRYTVVVASGSYSMGSLILHPGSDPFATCFIIWAHMSNNTNNAGRVDFYDRNDNLVFRINVGPLISMASPIGFLGIKMDGGFIRVYNGTSPEGLTGGVLNYLIQTVFK